LPENQEVYAPIGERGHTDLEEVERKIKEIISCGGGVISNNGLTFFEETFGQRNDVNFTFRVNHIE